MTNNPKPKATSTPQTILARKRRRLSKRVLPSSRCSPLIVVCIERDGCCIDLLLLIGSRPGGGPLLRLSPCIISIRSLHLVGRLIHERALLPHATTFHSLRMRGGSHYCITITSSD